MPAKGNPSLTYRYRKHWPRRVPDRGIKFPSCCGKNVPLWSKADLPGDVTCGTCRRVLRVQGRLDG